MRCMLYAFTLSQSATRYIWRERGGNVCSPVRIRCNRDGTPMYIDLGRPMHLGRNSGIWVSSRSICSASIHCVKCNLESSYTSVTEAILMFCDCTRYQLELEFKICIKLTKCGGCFKKHAMASCCESLLTEYRIGWSPALLSPSMVKPAAEICTGFQVSLGVRTDTLIWD